MVKTRRRDLGGASTPCSEEQSSGRARLDPDPDPDPDPSQNLVPRTLFSAGVVTPAQTLKSVSLHDWWLCKAAGKGLCVAGKESSGVKIFSSGPIRVFSSGPVSKRHDSTTLETVDGITVAISGMINSHRTQENGFSLEVCNQFLFGFPYDWEDYVEGYIDTFVRTSKLRSAEFKNDSDKTNFPVLLDDIPVHSIRDFLMLPLEGSEDCSKSKILDDVISRLRSFDCKHNPDPSRSETKDGSSINLENADEQESSMVHLIDFQECSKRKTRVDEQRRSSRSRGLKCHSDPGKSETKDGNQINLKNPHEQEAPTLHCKDSNDCSKRKTQVDEQRRSSRSSASKRNPDPGKSETQDRSQINLKASDRLGTLTFPLNDSQGRSKRKTRGTPVLSTGVKTRRMTRLTDPRNKQEDLCLSEARTVGKRDSKSQQSGNSRQKMPKKNLCSKSSCVFDDYAEFDTRDGNRFRGVVTRSASKKHLNG